LRDVLRVEKRAARAVASHVKGGLHNARRLREITAVAELDILTREMSLHTMSPEY